MKKIIKLCVITATMDIMTNIRLPSAIAHQIYLLSINTGHARCMKQYWVSQHKYKLLKILENLDTRVLNFRICNPITGEFRPAYAHYNYVFAEDDEDDEDYNICPGCGYYNQTGSLCYGCRHEDF